MPFSGREEAWFYSVDIHANGCFYLDFVAHNDSVIVKIRSIDLVTSVSWLVTNNGFIVTQNNVSTGSNMMSFRFVVSEDGRSKLQKPTH